MQQDCKSCKLGLYKHKFKPVQLKKVQLAKPLAKVIDKKKFSIGKV